MKEILVQAITSSGSGFTKPEEIAHQNIFHIDTDPEKVITENLKNSALRIEKDGSKCRFLFSDGAMANSAFREVVGPDLDLKPRYVGLFALKGFVDDPTCIPAGITFFDLTGKECDK